MVDQNMTSLVDTRFTVTTVDGWNPANQLRLVVYLIIIHKVLAPSQGGCFRISEPSTVSWNHQIDEWREEHPQLQNQL